MTEQQTITTPTHVRPDDDQRAPGAAAGRVLRTALWVVLVVALVGNMAASVAGVAWSGHVALGGLTAACVGALAVSHLQARRGARP
ncbi:hypothetical protein [Geodermatophilus sp. FMUSA9-8]|uniref:hypothetical protein n=1 Tax=Geodermatophilus sp. FMUSA9-8 TaxID=3120155 RepID=UPI00300BEE18